MAIDERIKQLFKGTVGMLSKEMGAELRARELQEYETGQDRVMVGAVLDKSGQPGRHFGALVVEYRSDGHLVNAAYFGSPKGPGLQPAEFPEKGISLFGGLVANLQNPADVRYRPVRMDSNPQIFLGIEAKYH